MRLKFMVPKYSLHKSSEFALLLGGGELKRSNIARSNYLTAPKVYAKLLYFEWQRGEGFNFGPRSFLQKGPSGSVERL